MEPTTIIAGIGAAIELYKALTGEEKTAEEWSKRLAKLKDVGEAGLEALLDLYGEIAQVSGKKARIAARAEEARRRNPAFIKGTLGLLLVAGLSLTASCSRMTTLQETATLRSGYAIEWPADASREPGDYHTSEVDGVMVTTVPRERE
ncbi:hypothetical protein GC173_08045 [bacterium]|nr:hypothetical protein [bacterium]